MKLSLVRRAAGLTALFLAISIVTPADSQILWQQFKAADLTGFSFTHTHLPDGRLVFGHNRQVQVQNAFGSPDFTTVTNLAAPDTRVFDPASIGVRSASSALIAGGGGFARNNGFFPFDPSTPATPIAASLTNPNPNAYALVWWAHPTSGRQGWLFTGTNAAGNNISYLSADGSVFGPVTTALSSFSGGLAVAAGGDVVTALTDLDANFLPTPLDRQVLRFTADQIDTAVAALISGNPFPIEPTAAANPLRAAASGSLAVDHQNRLWIAGFQIPYVQLWDPATSVLRRVIPLASAPADYVGPPSYAVSRFSESGTQRISVLANDTFYTAGSDLVLAHTAAEDVESRSVQFTTQRIQRSEFGSSTFAITVSITPPPTEPMSLQYTVSGSATAGSDYVLTPGQAIIAPGQSSTTLVSVEVLDNSNSDGDRSLSLTLLPPADDAHAGLGAPGTETVSIEILDNEIAPPIAATQSFPATIQVGRSFSHQVQLDRPNVFVTRWTATGLPPGLSIDRSSGLISGTPTTPGVYDRIVLTATNAFGTTTSVAYLLEVAPLPTPVVGSFSGFLERSPTPTNGLGGRLDLTVSSNAAYSATVTIGRQRFLTRGMLDGSAPQPSGILRANGQIFAFNINPATGAVSASIPLTGWRQAPVPPARSGVCNFAAIPPALPPVDQPQGACHGSITLSPQGTARIAGRLADGTAFSTSSAFGMNGRLLIYHPLYASSALGSFCGTVTMADSTSQAITGTLTWSKPAQPAGRLYRAGWSAPLALDISGGRYRPAAGATLPLDATPSIDNSPNAVLQLEEGGLDFFGDPVRTSAVQIVSATRIVTQLPIRLTINNRNGALGGQWPLVKDSTRSTAIFSGLLIPSNVPSAPFATTGFGHFTLPTDAPGVSRSGLLILDQP